MPRSRSKIALLLLVMTACLLEGVTPMSHPEVRRLGEKYRCMCGACSYTVASCNMMSCRGAEEGRALLYDLVQKGTSDEEVAKTFIDKYGKVVVNKPSTEGFDLFAWVMPPTAALLGLGFLWWAIKRFMRQKPVAATAGDTALLDKYRDTIEKDMSSLDE
jgi:cytochrome c-type biogenesis protein CcmH/NrfF